MPPIFSRAATPCSCPDKRTAYNGRRGSCHRGFRVWKRVWFLRNKTFSNKSLHLSRVKLLCNIIITTATLLFCCCLLHKYYRQMWAYMHATIDADAVVVILGPLGCCAAVCSSGRVHDELTRVPCAPTATAVWVGISFSVSSQYLTISELRSVVEPAYYFSTTKKCCFCANPCWGAWRCGII